MYIAVMCGKKRKVLFSAVLLFFFYSYFTFSQPLYKNIKGLITLAISWKNMAEAQSN